MVCENLKRHWQKVSACILAMQYEACQSQANLITYGQNAARQLKNSMFLRQKMEYEMCKHQLRKDVGLYDMEREIHDPS